MNQLYKRELAYFDNSNECSCNIRNVKNYAPKIKNIDMNILNTMVTDKFYDGDIMDILSCVFMLVLRTNIKKKSKNDIIPLSSSIIEWFRKMEYISSGIEGSTFTVDFGKISKYIIIKAPHLNVHAGNIFHEYFIGITALNKLRKHVPNFVYALGIFSCPPFKQDNKGNIVMNKFCTYDNKNKMTNYLIYERIPGKTFRHHIYNSTLKDYEVLTIIIQLLAALQVAFIKYRYTHYDLHLGNIMIRELDDYKNVKYKFTNSLGNKKTLYITTKYIPTIIDYGYSYVHLNGENYGRANMPSYGIYNDRPSPIHDIYKMILLSLTTSKPSKLSFLKNYFKTGKKFLKPKDKYVSFIWKKHRLVYSDYADAAEWIIQNMPTEFKKYVKQKHTKLAQDVFNVTSNISNSESAKEDMLGVLMD